MLARFTLFEEREVRKTKKEKKTPVWSLIVLNGITFFCGAASCI